MNTVLFKTLNFLLLIGELALYTWQPKPIILFFLIGHGVLFFFHFMNFLIRFEPGRKVLIHQQAIRVARGKKMVELSEKMELRKRVASKKLR